MKWRFTLFMPVLFMAVFMAAFAQEPMGAGASEPVKKSDVSVAVPVKPETKVSIRDLQVEQDGLIIRMKAEETDIEKLRQQIADYDMKINQAAQKDAAAQKIDITKYLFDIGKMLWTPKEGEKK